MKPLTMKQAGDLSGTSKSTIYRMVKSGKLSAQKDDDGIVRIDPSELSRAFPDFNPAQTNPSQGPVSGVSADSERSSDTDNRSDEMYRLKYVEAVSRLKAIEESNQDLRAQTDDLRGRLDRAESERRQQSAQITALLTDQSQQQKRRSKGWWQIWGR